MFGRRRIAVAISGALLTALTLGGCADSGEPTPSVPATESRHNVGGLAAIDTAETELGGTAFALEWEPHSSRVSWPRWYVDVLVGETAYEMTLTQDGVDISNTEAIQATPDTKAQLQAVAVSLPEALDTALLAVPGTIANAALLEVEGAVTWHIQIAGPPDPIAINQPPPHDVYVDAVTGEIRE